MFDVYCGGVCLWTLGVVRLVLAHLGTFWPLFWSERVEIRVGARQAVNAARPCARSKVEVEPARPHAARCSAVVWPCEEGSTFGRKDFKGFAVPRKRFNISGAQIKS